MNPPRLWRGLDPGTASLESAPNVLALIMLSAQSTDFLKDGPSRDDRSDSFTGSGGIGACPTLSPRAKRHSSSGRPARPLHRGTRDQRSNLAGFFLPLRNHKRFRTPRKLRKRECQTQRSGYGHGRRWRPTAAPPSPELARHRPCSRAFFRRASSVGA